MLQAMLAWRIQQKGHGCLKTVTVSTGMPYSVQIEPGLITRVGEETLHFVKHPCSVMVVTDDRVDSLYGEKVRQSFNQKGFHVHSHVFPHGEASKTLPVWMGILNALADKQLTRADIVVALGGGVVGDVAGFAASAYLRGLPFIQIPTTLLAMVDSSIGGKTGINLPMGKNMAGTFHQPLAVLCDPGTLATLRVETLRDGLAEAVKTSLLRDPGMFDWFRTGDYTHRMEEIIARCVRIKAEIVAEDEYDSGIRRMLNLGHTFGHAIEKASAYSVSHGGAVAAGLAYASRLSYKLGICGEAVLTDVLEALKRCGLPASAPYPARMLFAVALSDKKRMGDRLTLILLKGIGDPIFYPVPVEKMEKMFHCALEDS